MMNTPTKPVHVEITFTSSKAPHLCKQTEKSNTPQLSWVSPQRLPQQTSQRQTISLESSLKLQIICHRGRSFKNCVGLIT